jgi:coenzyme F420 biosynthesis associated uncharacterized protein
VAPVSPTAAARLLDWRAAARIGSGIAGAGPARGGPARPARAIDLSEAMARADELVSSFTGLRSDGTPSRAWVMTRAEWIEQNVRGFERLLEPVAERLLGKRADSASAPIRRGVLALQLGAVLGYLARKVLGQYDILLPADDRDVVYFVGPNVAELEARFRFSAPDFRLWLALHEVTHRLQFEGVPWLRGHLGGLVAEYLASLELDPRKLLDTLRRAAEEARRSGGWRELGVVSLLMTPGQRQTFRRMQALMSLLEGHGTYVMDALSEGNVEGAERMRRVLHERRTRRGWNRVVQRAVGIDVKVRQYDIGERFVASAVAESGMEGFSRVWERPENLPTLVEIGRPSAWVERVSNG